MHRTLEPSRTLSPNGSAIRAGRDLVHRTQERTLEWEESELIGLILAGDTHLFQNLVEPYEQRLYRMALGIVRNPSDAEDVVQESYLKAFLNLAKFRFDARFSTWLTSIALNEARSIVKARRHIAFEVIDTCSELDGNEYLNIVCGKPLPVQIVEQAELRNFVAKAVSGLHPTYREIYDLRETEELSTELAAEQLGIPIPLAKTRLHRARRMLQRRLVAMIRIDSVSTGSTKVALPV